MSKRRFVCLALAVQLTILVATGLTLVLGQGALAQSASAASVQHYSLLAETMQPIDSTIAYDNYLAFLKTTQDSTLPTHLTSYIGQLHLPDGAAIVGAKGYLYDTDPNTEARFAVFRYRLDSMPVFSTVASYASTGIPYASGNIVLDATITASNAVVDNANYSYAVYLILPKAQTGRLEALRFLVDTSYSAYLPLVER